MDESTCLTIFACRKSPLWKGTVTLSEPFPIDSVAAFGAAASNLRSTSRAVHRGSLGIYVDGGGQDITAEENIAFVVRQSFEIQLNCFFDISDRLFKRVALRLAPSSSGHQAYKPAHPS